jgi:HEAT repeat protein
VPIARRDASWHVEGEANRSLGKLRVEGAFEAISANMDRSSFRQVVRGGCIDGLVALRDERAVDPVLRAARYGEPFQSRPVAIRALARLAVRFEPRRKEISDALVDYLRDPDFRVRLAAANALKTAGNGEHAAELDAMRDRELDGRAVRVARQTSSALRKGETVPEEVRKLRDELEELRRDHQKLSERLEAQKPRKS